LLAGADVDHVLRFMTHEGVETSSVTALVGTASLGHAPLVALLIESGADVNKPEPYEGFTALHV
jgi:hypothetical protein